MARSVEEISVQYRDEKGITQTMRFPVAPGITVGQLLDRCTNGAVTEDSHVISRNGEEARLNEPISDGDKVTASPKKTIGAG